MNFNFDIKTATAHLRLQSVYCQLLAILSVILICKQTAIAEGFQAQGFIVVKNISADGEVMQQYTQDFDISVNNCKWHIFTSSRPPSSMAGISHWEIGSDGEGEIYQVASYDKKNLPAETLNDSIGAVENDVVPDNIAANQVSEIWLAYGSSCYFDSVTNKLIKPIYRLINPTLRSQNYAVKADWTRLESSPHLPNSVTYLLDQIETSHDKYPAPVPFEKGYTRAEYKVLTTTNVGGVVLPKSFYFKEFAVVQTSKADSHLVVRRVVEGFLTDMRASCERTVFRPELMSATYVDDRRFTSRLKPVLSLSYMVTNRTWPETNKQELIALYEDEVRRQKLTDIGHATQANLPVNAPVNDLQFEPVSRSSWKRVFIILFIVLSFFPLGFLIMKMGAKGKKPTK